VDDDHRRQHELFLHASFKSPPSSALSSPSHKKSLQQPKQPRRPRPLPQIPLAQK
ncbi:Hypothetical protein FKW44_023263, partial [Caligus rogercresseyi]